MKQEYEMTQADMDKILDACRPVPCILVGGYAPSSQQDNANRAWCSLGERMGFDGMSVEPSSRGGLFFLATPKETKRQCKERLEAAAAAEVARCQDALDDAHKKYEAACKEIG